ncbi:MAG: hypothetical protein EHM79_02145 [Geobacter sp.]|nr:MAG: hypothetical protein EHM79_02145 [Geobacter sp.]
MSLKDQKPLSKPFSYSADIIAQQPERQRLIDKIIYVHHGFTKIDDRGDFARVFVTRSFLSQDFDTRKSLITLVQSYYAVNNNVPAEDYSVVVHDSLSGKEIGTLQRGELSMDK